MNPIVVEMFCNQTAAQSNQPGEKLAMVALMGVPPSGATAEKKASPSPNAAMFKEGNGNVALNLANITSELAAGFEAGKRYTVTIEEVTVV